MAHQRIDVGTEAEVNAVRRVEQPLGEEPRPQLHDRLPAFAIVHVRHDEEQ
jgi:hypothetical protein